MTLLHEDLACVFAPVTTILARAAVLFWVVALLEWLQGGHEVVSTSYTVCDNAFGDTSCDSTFDDSGDGVHRPDDLGLELRRYVELDLLEEVF